MVNSGTGAKVRYPINQGECIDGTRKWSEAILKIPKQNNHFPTLMGVALTAVF